MGVKGRLKDMSLVDVVQIFNAENKTAAIHLGSENGYARVYICEGRIVHAIYRELTGTEALFLVEFGVGELPRTFIAASARRPKELLSIMATLRIVPMGFARPLPAISGAEP